MSEEIEIKLMDVTISDWIDASSRDGSKYIPKTMTISAVINNIYTQNIMLPYIPITSKNEIIQAIIKNLSL